MYPDRTKTYTMCLNGRTEGYGRQDERRVNPSNVQWGDRQMEILIAMTANAFAEDVQAAKGAGMNGHIAKPINILQMVETLKKVLK